MTQAEWAACDDVGPMLEFLRGRASDRKLRLFGVACCRRIWHWLTNERGRKAIELAERFADGHLHPRRFLGVRELQSAWDEAGASPSAFLWNPGHFAAQYSDWAATRSGTQGTQAAECAAQPVLLRDLSANPFPPVPLAPAWLPPTCSPWPGPPTRTAPCPPALW